VPDLVKHRYKSLVQNSRYASARDPREIRSAQLILATAPVAGLLLAAVVGIDPAGLLYLGPVLVLFAALLARPRRYPGQRLLVRLAGAGARARKRARSLARTPRARIAVMVARGGLLMARSLAVRPPPVAISSS